MHHQITKPSLPARIYGQIGILGKFLWMPGGAMLEERGRMDREEPAGWKFLKAQVWGNEGRLGRGGEVGREGSKLLPEGH